MRRAPMRFRGPAIATFLQRAEENLALLGAQLEGPGDPRQRRASSSTSPPRERPPGALAAAALSREEEYDEEATEDYEKFGASKIREKDHRKAAHAPENQRAPRAGAGQKLVEGWLRQCAGGRGELAEALGVFAESEREVREQMDIQARTLLGIDRKVKAFDGRLRAAAEEAAAASASSARLEQRVEGGSASSYTASPLPGSAAATAASAAEVCSCGNAFAPDAVFCRRCGAKRLVEGLLATELAELRAQHDLRLEALDIALEESRRGEWVEEAAREHARQTSTELVGELARGVRQQLDDFHSHMEARYEQRLSSLDKEIRRHAEEVARELLDEFLQGPALEVRVGALFAALQSRTVGLGPGILQAAAASQGTELPSPRENQRWAPRAEFLALEATVGGLRDDICGLTSRLALQTQELASMESKLAEAVQSLKAQPPPVSERTRAVSDLPPRQPATSSADKASASTQPSPRQHSKELPQAAPVPSPVAIGNLPGRSSVRDRVAALESAPPSSTPSTPRPLSATRSPRISTCSSAGGSASGPADASSSPKAAAPAPFGSKEVPKQASEVAPAPVVTPSFGSQTVPKRLSAAGFSDDSPQVQAAEEAVPSFGVPEPAPHFGAPPTTEASSALLTSERLARPSPLHFAASAAPAPSFGGQAAAAPQSPAHMGGNVGVQDPVATPDIYKRAHGHGLSSPANSRTVLSSPTARAAPALPPLAIPRDAGDAARPPPSANHVQDESDGKSSGRSESASPTSDDMHRRNRDGKIATPVADSQAARAGDLWDAVAEAAVPRRTQTAANDAAPSAGQTEELWSSVADAAVPRHHLPNTRAEPTEGEDLWGAVANAAVPRHCDNAAADTGPARSEDLWSSVAAATVSNRLSSGNAEAAGTSELSAEQLWSAVADATVPRQQGVSQDGRAGVEEPEDLWNSVAEVALAPAGAFPGKPRTCPQARSGALEEDDASDSDNAQDATVAAAACQGWLQLQENKRNCLGKGGTVLVEEEELEVLIIEETVTQPHAGSPPRRHQDHDIDLVVEDVFATEETNTSSSASSPLSRSQRSVGTSKASPSPRVIPAGTARVGGTRAAAARNDPPSMELWDQVLTELRDEPIGPGGVAEVTYSGEGDVSESSLSSPASSSEAGSLPLSVR